METFDIKTLDIKTLHDIARMAWGSSEKESGGRGYMGVIKDEQGRLRVIKYDTHFNQSSSANKNDMSQCAAAQLLRAVLVEIADRKNIDGDVLNAIRNKLGMAGGAAKDPPKKLLERKVVASVVKMIDKDIWSNAIDKDVNIKEYSSKDKDTRFSTVVRNVRVKGNEAILTPLVNDKEIVDRKNNVSKGLECLLKEANAGNDADVTSCFGWIVPAEVKRLYAAEVAIDRLKNRTNPDYKNLDDDLNCLAEEYGLDEKQKDKLRSVAEEAIYSDDNKEDECYDKLDEKLDELQSGDFEKWQDLNEKYQDFYYDMGLITKTSSRKKIKKIANVPIRKMVPVEYHKISVDHFNNFATSIKDNGDPVEALLEKFGCSLDDLQKFEELGKNYSAACVAAKDEFDKLEKALEEKLGSEGQFKDWCEQLKKDFKTKLDSASKDMLNSLGNLKQQLSELPGMIKKCLDEKKLTAQDLLAKDLDHLLSVEEDIRNEAADAQKAAAAKTELRQGKKTLIADLAELEKELGGVFVSYLKEPNIDEGKKQIEGNLNKLKGILTKVVNNYQGDCHGSDFFDQIRSVYKDLEKTYPSDFVKFFDEFNPTGDPVDVVSKIQDRVRQLRDVAQMRDRLNVIGDQLKKGGTSEVVEHIDHKIYELKCAFGEKILDSKSVDNALEEIEKMSPDNFLDDLTVEELVAADTEEVQANLAKLNVKREIKGALDKLGKDFKDKNCVFEHQLPNGKKIHLIIARENDALIDQKIAALNEKFEQELGEDFKTYGDKCDAFKEKFGFISKLPVAAFIGFSVDDLVNPNTEAFKPLVLAQEKLLGEGGAAMKLQGIPAFYWVADRLGDFVSGLVAKLANGNISVADATRDVNVIAKLPGYALADIADLGAISTDDKIKAKAVDALKQAIFGGMDNEKNVNVAVEFGGVDVWAFVNSGTLAAKDADGDQWRDAMANLASLVGDKCKGWSFGAAFSFVVNQYTASSSSLLQGLPGRYNLYHDLLYKLADKVEALSSGLSDVNPFITAMALEKVVGDFCKDERPLAEIGNELSDLISLVKGLCDNNGKIAAFSEVKQGNLDALAALEERLIKDQQVKDDVKTAAEMLRTAIKSQRAMDGEQTFSEVLEKFKNLTSQQFASLRGFDIEDIQKGKFDLRDLVARAENFVMIEKLRSRFGALPDGPTKDAFEKAAGLLTSAIEDGRTLGEMQAFGNALKALVDPSQDLYQELTPQQFATLREDDIGIIKQGFFVPKDLVSREANFREIESAIGELSARMMAESKYGPSDEKAIRALYGNIEALRLRLKSRIVPTVPPFSADGLIMRSLRNLAALKYLDFKMFAAYCGEGLDMLFSRLDRLMDIEIKLDAASAKVKSEKPGQNQKIDDRIAKIKEYLGTYVLWDTNGKFNKAWEANDHKDDLVANVAVGKFAEMGDAEFSSVLVALKKIHEWRAAELDRRNDSDNKAVAPILTVSRHCEAGLLNGSMTPDDVDHRLKFLSGLSDRSPNKIDEAGDLAKSASDIFGERTIAEGVDEKGNVLPRTAASKFEEMLFDGNKYYRGVAKVALEAIEHRWRNHLSLESVFKCKTYDQIWQTVRDITAVGETFDWLGEQLKDELSKSRIAGVSAEDVVARIGQFKTSVEDALYRGDITLDAVGSRLKVLFDVPMSIFAKTWLAGKNPQLTLDSLWQSCDKVKSRMKSSKEVSDTDPLANLAQEIYNAPKVKKVSEAFLYAFERYEKRSSYLKNKATLTERIHFRNFIREAWKCSGRDRALEKGYDGSLLEFGGALGDCFVPSDVAYADYQECIRRDPRHGGGARSGVLFVLGDRIVQDIYEHVFMCIKNCLDESKDNVRKPAGYKDDEEDA